MGDIAHPNGDGRIEVEIIDTESYRGTDVVQVQAAEDGVDLSDQSGDAPWVEESEVEGIDA